ncbi:MAG: hypothetical protein ACE37K_20395 [Planctomycetota bacterium]
MRANLLLLSAGVLALGGVLPAQNPTPVIELPTGIDPADLPPEVRARLEQMQAQGAQGPQGQQPAAGNNAQDQKQAAEAAKLQKRLVAFKKLVFDRRPSSILKAWAQPELKPYDPKEEEKKGKDGKPAGGAAQPGGQPGGQPGVQPGSQPGTQPGTASPTTTGSALQPSSRAIRISRTSSGATLTAPARPAATTTPAQPVATGTPSSTPSSSSSSAMSPAQIQALIDAETGGKPAEAQPAANGAAAAAAPAGPKADPALEAKILQRELEMLQRDVTLSRWDEVAKFFDTLAEKDRKGAYEHFLKTLLRHPNKPPSRLPANLQEKNRFSFDEAFVLAGMAPGGFDKQQAKLLGPIVQRAMDGGGVREEWIRLLGIEVGKAKETRRVDRREAALILSALNMNDELGAFLPTASQAEKNDDREAFNLLARHALAMYAKDNRGDWLETAWEVTQAALAKGEIQKAQKEEALRRAVDLAPKVRAELGPAWLEKSFTERPERGMEIVATIGGQVASGFATQARNASYRATGLKLQKTAVEALLATAPKLADEWKETLELLAAGWVQEASHSNRYSKTTSYGSYMERDSFGNVYWTNRRMGGGGQVTAIEPEDLLESQPSDRWASLLGADLRPNFTTVSAQLWLKVNEYDKAFPYIERLATTNGRKAKELADEFLRVWKRNNNPNASNRGSNYIYVYGFSDRANSIPLTRSKQERNLKELSDYVARLRALPMEPVDANLLTEAFVAAHSLAEVYQLDTIRQVFGEISELDPIVLGQLIGRMRMNLATVWRTPSVQQQAKTRRSQKEMMQEVANGYATALKLAQDSLISRGRHWSLLTAVATLLHDQNNFKKEIMPDSSFSEVRKGAFELLAEAADHYASVCADMTRNEETDTVFTSWFYAALGASDLGAIDETMVVANSQLPRIKEAMEALPDGSRERMQARFANLLFTRMSSVKPDIKFRYLKAGFEITGDHEQTKKAREVWQYYQDLIGEIRLEVVVDGSSQVGTEPFGVRIDIVHTDAVGRESGGFQKYATNQNNMQYAYNYGRPTENYRDKFHDAAIASLQENFEILSATFNSENMEPLQGDEDGWQRTPYAYLLLQARGPQVDRIPEVKLDLDFKDTTGFFIMPVVSSPVAVDASREQLQRPFEGLEVSQLLDERKVDEGKVTLEIKAKSEGLVPDLEDILELETPGFKVSKMDDQGAAVVRFSPDQDAIESERVWLIALEPESAGASPGSFRFGQPKLDDMKTTYQRYDDADLETVTAEIALRRGPIGSNPWWAWLLLGAGAVLYLVWFFFAKPADSAPVEDVAALRMPESVTPFSVLALLHQIRMRGDFVDEQRTLLEVDMRRIEAGYFDKAAEAAESGERADLEKIARHWLSKAS